MASERTGALADFEGGRILTLEDVSDREWTLVSSTTANGCALTGDDGDGAKVRDVVDLGESGHPSAGSTLGGGLRSPSTSTSDDQQTPPQHDNGILAAIIDCTDNLRALRDEKERSRANLDNFAQATADQANASQLTMDQLIDVRRNADPMLQTIEEQIIKDLSCQLEIDRQALSQKTTSMRSLSDTVRSLEANISAEEARLATLLKMSHLCPKA